MSFKHAPFLLAFDTTGETGSIALADGATLIEQVTISSPDGIAQVLFGEIETLLARHGVTLQDMVCFATASGPGSFTGVRVGITAAKGLAEAAGRPVVAISNLQAIAWQHSGDLRAVWVDARRGEIYGAVYNAQLELVQEETCAPLSQWTAALPPGANIATQSGPLAAAVAAIAWHRLQAGVTQDPAEIDANYVRRSDAEMMWTETRP